MASSASQLSLAAVQSGYGRVKVVQNVSLEVATGEIVAVIGRNGVGKSTLMKTIIGEIAPMSGAVSFRGLDVTRLDAARRARLGVGYVPQGRDVFARMTVGENLALGRRVGGAPAANLERVFGFFPILEKRLAQPAGSMSGGEQQQLAIGRILAGRPDIILLDEPSEGVQPNIVQEIGRIIRRLRDEERLTVLIVEQNLSLIRAVADRCVIMDKGAVVGEIAPEALDDPETAARYLSI
ncbi:branched-chain amino acid transport system ATP-binding protein [Methylopila capsulata]|uniref:ABC transporter ATP-binding protein n=1 Tax=Methylopila capsulata TaxID=61654 RepID=A0A9W6MSQ6_9HYPH|nr:ABC transporter ATP-binding protein [Methylopila capsulata]MBM7852353.1 branched-chain amino acid transport system ATP-binding protein [Methylopila capsulata]GLK56563.1 ABC transporter ATP-binding protein [Methylopila capsulata]